MSIRNDVYLAAAVVFAAGGAYSYHQRQENIKSIEASLRELDTLSTQILDRADRISTALDRYAEAQFQWKVDNKSDSCVFETYGTVAGELAKPFYGKVHLRVDQNPFIEFGTGHDNSDTCQSIMVSGSKKFDVVTKHEDGTIIAETIVKRRSLMSTITVRPDGSVAKIHQGWGIYGPNGKIAIVPLRHPKQTAAYLRRQASGLFPEAARLAK
jgi:hypothetical protein